MTSKKTKIAIVYDFDRTLSTSEMQDSFIRSLGMEPKKFWEENTEFAKKNNMDKILSYLYLMKDKTMKSDTPFNREVLKRLGSDIEFYNGVETWFDSIDRLAAQYDVVIEHYIISSGLKEIIEGTPIAKKFKEIYACEYYYDKDGIPTWVKNVINYTSKTQFLFRINKRALEIWDDSKVNEFVYHDERPIPFDNMIYIGDGDTDIPCMKIVKQYGGYSIAVYPDGKKKNVQKMMYDGRITHYCKADYSEESELFNLMSQIIHKISIDAPLRNHTFKQYKESSKRFEKDE